MKMPNWLRRLFGGKSKLYLGYMSPADKAVVPGLESHEIVYAADQPQYKPLRVLKATSEDQRVMSRWSFTPEQREAIADGADLYLTQLVFEQALQPVVLAVGFDQCQYHVGNDFELPGFAGFATVGPTYDGVRYSPDAEWSENIRSND